MCKSFETRLYIHSVVGDYWLLTHDRWFFIQSPFSSCYSISYLISFLINKLLWLVTSGKSEARYTDLALNWRDPDPTF